jgi:hypothetical protein
VSFIYIRSHNVTFLSPSLEREGKEGGHICLIL